MAAGGRAGDRAQLAAGLEGAGAGAGAGGDPFLLQKMTDQSMSSVSEGDPWYGALSRAFSKHSLKVTVIFIFTSTTMITRLILFFSSPFLVMFKVFWATTEHKNVLRKLKRKCIKIPHTGNTKSLDIYTATTNTKNVSMYFNLI